MSGINLLPKDKQETGSLSKVRHWVMLVTTIVLVIYVVGAAGVVGWWFFLVTQDTLATQAIAKTEAQIRQVSTTEALVWETNKRVDLIGEFLQKKASLTSPTAALVPTEGVAVASYKYAPLEQSIQVAVNELAELEKYTERLKPTFPQIVNFSIVGKGSANWEADIKL